MKPAAAILLMTVVAYLPALRAGWIWDDDYYITDNHNLRSAEGLKHIWTRFGLENGGTPQYYPVTFTTFWIEYHLWGLRPSGYHLVNVLLHATNAILLWLILKKLQVPGAWLAAAVFALHPVHVESVAWVTERKNTLSGVFYLGAMMAYLASVFGFRASGLGDGQRPEPESRDPQLEARAVALYAISLALFILALLSKSVTASLPAAILLVIWWKRGRLASRDVLPLVPMFVLGIAMGILTSWMEREHVGATGSEWDLSVWQRILIGGRAVWFYAIKLVAPFELAFIYPRWEVDPRHAWQWIFPVAAIALAVFAWAMRKRWGRGPLVAVLFFGGTLLPALGFVNLLPMRYSFVADHFQYLASIGLIALFAAVATVWLHRRARVLAALWLIGLGLLTFRQAFAYRDLDTLWRHTIAKNPTGWMPRNNLANLLMNRGEVDEAERLMKVALQHHPTQPEVLVTYGTIMERRGRLAEAAEAYERASASGHNVVALTNLARLYLSADRLDDAVALLARAIAADATYAPAYLYTGLARAAQGNLPAAAEAFERATRLDPASAEAWNNLGATLENLGDRAAAVRAYERALAADPAFEKARRNLERARSSRLVR